MKAFITRFSLLLILGLTALFAKAQTVTIDKIKYSINTEAKTATVSGYTEGIINANIKSSVTYNDNDYTVTEIGSNAFSFCNSLIKVTIPNTVTLINNSAFACSNLSEVTIPNSVTQIEWEAFNGCNEMTEVTIGNSVTSIGNYAFQSCSNLKSITVDKDNRNFADIDGILYNKNISVLIQCPGGKTKATVPNTVTEISGEAFCNCKKLIDINLGNSIISIGDGAFMSCSSLTEVTIPNSVTSIGLMAFYECYNLSSVTIPKNITKIGDQAFSRSYQLTSVIYETENPIEGSPYIFDSYTKTTLYVPKNAIEKCKEIDPWKNFKNIAAITVSAESVKLDKAAVELKIGETATLTATVSPENTTDKTVTWKSSNEKIATVDANGKITAIALGEAVITATCGEAKAECEVTVKPVPAESVKLDKAAVELKIGETATLTATVSPENTTDKTVTWASSNEKIATVDANGKITAVALGEAVITATCGEAKAECKVTVKPVPAESVKLDEAAVELKIGETATLTATVSPENTTDKTVTWKSSNEKVATVDANGKITAIALGEAVITATCGEAKAECKVTIKPVPAESITLDKYSVVLKIGESATVTATVNPENTTNKTVTWASSDEKVATVDANGKITAIALGEAVITATCGEAKAECKVTVKPVPAESITLDKYSVVLKIGETATVTATVNPENTTDKTVTWKSSDEKIATVDANGKITAIALGEAVITATCGEAKAECNVGVTAVPVESVKLDKQALEMKVGESQTLNATVSPDNATYKTVAWSSSNPSVATVDSEGKVTAAGVGEAVITAACGEAKAECQVTVKPIPAESIKLDKQALALKVGDSKILNAIVYPDNATDKTVTWSSSNDKVATVDANGRVTATGIGEAIITATCGEAKAECNVGVTAVPVESVKLDKQALEMKVGESQTLNATVSPDNATYKTVAWSSSNTNVATVDSEGKVTAVGVGEAVITAACGEAKAECKVTVKPVPVESVKLDKQALKMKVGDVKTLSATVSPDNATYKTVAWSSSNPNVATVDSEGKVTAVGVGEAVITAACGDAKAECQVTVKPVPAESIKLDKQALALKVGDSKILNAIVTPDNATDKTVTWSSSNDKVATVDANGRVTATGIGEAIITATCGEAKAECYVTVTAESGIEAAKANEPVVTVSAQTINVWGVADDCKVSVYNLSGEMIASETGCCSIAVANRGVYIVMVGNKVVKVAI